MPLCFSVLSPQEIAITIRNFFFATFGQITTNRNFCSFRDFSQLLQKFRNFHEKYNFYFIFIKKNVATFMKNTLFSDFFSQTAVIQLFEIRTFQLCRISSDRRLIVTESAHSWSKHKGSKATHAFTHFFCQTRTFCVRDHNVNRDCNSSLH